MKLPANLKSIKPANVVSSSSVLLFSSIVLTLYARVALLVERSTSWMGSFSSSRLTHSECMEEVRPSDFALLAFHLLCFLYASS